MGTQSSSGAGFGRSPQQGHNNGELHRAEEEIGHLRDRMGALAERASDVVKENPLAALAGAAVVGFVFARLISRRW